jgi:phosphoenolpyruvate carboxykinase (GTP)
MNATLAAGTGVALNVPATVKHKRLVAWVGAMAALCKPERVHWCDGSDAYVQRALSPA